MAKRGRRKADPGRNRDILMQWLEGKNMNLLAREYGYTVYYLRVLIRNECVLMLAEKIKDENQPDPKVHAKFITKEEADRRLEILANWKGSTLKMEKYV